MLLSGHPWVYRDALEPHDLPPGMVVGIRDTRGRILAQGLTEAGPIGVRVFVTGSKERVGAGLYRARIAQALDLRTRVIPEQTDAYRLLHGEGDRLPGLVCDVYGHYAVVKLDGEAIATQLDVLRPLLEEALVGLGVRGALLRRSRRAGSTVEPLFGETVPGEVCVQECGMALWANLWAGQKTGLFLDHRPARAQVRRLAAGLRVLNLYGYTGGFSVAAGLGGAQEVTTVDVAQPALDLAERSFIANGLPAASHHVHGQDVPAFLEEARQGGARYDLIVADPPNFAPNVRGVDKARESYQKLHGACCGLVRPGGLYLAASCSSHIRMPEFLEDLRKGAARARRILTVLEQHGAPPDHPRLLSFPEGDYLKVVLCGVAAS